MKIVERIARTLLLSGLVFLLGACAVGQKYNLTTASPDLKIASPTAIGVGVQDKRDYVVSGRNQPRIAGLVRGGWGNPFYVTTTSGRPLVEDMQESICNAIKQKGVNPLPVTLVPAEADADVIKEMTATGARRSLLLRLKEWQPDFSSGGTLALKFNMELSVLNASGIMVASKNVSGNDTLGKKIWGTSFMKVYQQKVSEAFAQKIEVLFNDPEVMKGLR